MTINININGEKKEFDFEKYKKVAAPFLWIGSFVYFNRSLNSVLKPQRNIGYLINMVTAGVTADFVTVGLLGKKEEKKEEEVEETAVNEDNRTLV